MKKPTFENLGVVMMILTPIMGLIFSVWALGKLSEDATGMTQPYKDAIGTKIVLAGDTLTVVDYSILKNTVTLSNTQSISFEFYKKIKEK